MYHAYLSDNWQHDQSFVKIVIESMLEGQNMDGKFIIIESDNCTAQYKSVKHFFHLQTIRNMLHKRSL